MKWLWEGDRNSKLFHQSVAIKHAKLSIHRIKNSAGVWLDSPQEIAAHASEFFQALFSEDAALPPTQEIDDFLNLLTPGVSDADNAKLLAPVSIEEVRRIVFLMDSESAPGPDGFSGAFFQSCWDIVGQDVLAAVQEFMAGVPLPKSISSALMVLLPKKPSPSTFADFRPISMCNFTNKIFTRLICERLRDLLPSLISLEQSAFLKGRDIIDNVLLAQ